MKKHARTCPNCHKPVVEWFRTRHIVDTVFAGDEGWATFARPGQYTERYMCKRCGHKVAGHEWHQLEMVEVAWR